MRFCVSSGEICEQVNTNSHEEAVKIVFGRWNSDHQLGLVTECAVVGVEEKTRWFDTQSMLSRMDIAYRIDTITQEIHWVII